MNKRYIMQGFYINKGGFTWVVKLTVLFTIVSCVPNRKITLLQDNGSKKDIGKITNTFHCRKFQTGVAEYLLNPNDLLDIKISTMTPSSYNPFNDADRTLVPGMVYGQTGTLVQAQGYYIDGSGFVDLPIIGRISVAGLTIMQAEDSISLRVQKYLDRPVVRLKLLNFRFSVMGEVGREDTYQAGDNTLTLLQALSMAGGASEFGDLSRLKIIRLIDDHTYVYYADLLKENFLESPFYYIQPNDVVIVPPLRQRSFLKYMNPNLSILATTVSLVVAIVSMISR